MLVAGTMVWVLGSKSSNHVRFVCEREIQCCFGVFAIFFARPSLSFLPPVDAQDIELLFIAYILNDRSAICLSTRWHENCLYV